MSFSFAFWSPSLPRQEFSYFSLPRQRPSEPDLKSSPISARPVDIQRPNVLPLPDALPRHIFATFSAVAQVLDSFGLTAITFASELRF